MRSPPPLLGVALSCATVLLARGAAAQADAPEPVTTPPEEAPPASPDGAPSGSDEAPEPPGGAAPAPAPPTPPTPDEDLVRPPPLIVEYLQYGVAIAAEMNVASGAPCPPERDTNVPCIFGSGGGLVIRGGYRSSGPWYFGGAYEFVKMDSGNLYRLGIFQQLRAEMRYLPDLGSRLSPYATWGIGGVAYGNEWGAETGGALAFGGGGVEFEVSRAALLGLGFVYRPTLMAGWTDTAGQRRETGFVQFLGFEFLLELRQELGRR